jgi:hypothetical protein
MSNGFTTGGNATITYSEGKDLEEMEGVRDVAKGRVLTKGATEVDQIAQALLHLLL